MQTEATSRNTVIIGAGPAGLAVGACLRKAGVPFIMLEQADRPGSSWHSHYERLHLHTNKGMSQLPLYPFPQDFPRYPSRQQMADHLKAYAEHFELEPRFGQHVTSVRREGVAWVTQTEDAQFRSDHVVVATGLLRVPHVPSWPGQEEFEGDLLHTSEYANGAKYKGKDVLVVGFGNSGTEIAIDLWEHGARPHVAVRSPVNIIPRDLLGIPIVAVAAPFNWLPAGLVDAFMAPVLRLLYGNLRRRGLRKLPYGPLAQLQHHQRFPVLDFGVMKLIKDGHVPVQGGIDRFEGNKVVFEDGSRKRFDAVILATGYRSHVDETLEDGADLLDDDGTPRASGCEILPGLFFCGFHVIRGALLKEIASEAKRIARLIRAKSDGSAVRSTAAVGSGTAG
jgi:indole-3-pyruvate monooxygenase